MPLTPNFSVSQTAVNPAYVVFTDTSSGSDGDIVSRRIYVTDSDGEPIVPDGVTTTYIAWPLATNPLNVDLLTQDAAVNIRVDWLDAGDSVLYTKNTNYALTQFSQQFLYYLIQLQSQNYNIIQDKNYWSNVGIFWANVIGAIKAVEVGNDIAASQACINRAIFMYDNQTMYF